MAEIEALSRDAAAGWALDVDALRAEYDPRIQMKTAERRQRWDTFQTGDAERAEQIKRIQLQREEALDRITKLDKEICTELGDLREHLQDHIWKARAKWAEADAKEKAGE